jgi:hypothetical protein
MFGRLYENQTVASIICVPNGTCCRADGNDGNVEGVVVGVLNGHHRIHSECGPCYTEHGLREDSSACQ